VGRLTRSAPITGLEGIIVGALVSIPIAILAPLATPRVAQRLARSNELRALARRDDLTAEHAKIEKYRDDPSTLHLWLLGRILITTHVSATTGVFAGLFYAAGNFSLFTESGLEQSYLAFAGQLVSVIGGATIVGVVTGSYRVWRKVNHFDAYSADVQRLLAELGP
jgi:hypothetical protein